jgi:hypothetical protein
MDKKATSFTTTTPLYETTGPDGQKVTFTPSDLVAGNGSIKSKSGKPFKLTKYKGSSLSDRVNSEDFGRVKK